MNAPMRLTVLGTGYLGITDAACMASLGFYVLGVDIAARKVDQLTAGELPVYEPGLSDLPRSGLDSGWLAFTTSYRRAAAFGDVRFICAGTPPQPGSDYADLSQVYGCVAALASLLDQPCPRIGSAFLRPGLDFGGGCLPKDIRAFIAWPADLEAEQALGFLREVDAINLRRRTGTADLASELVGRDLAGVPGGALTPPSDRRLLNGEAPRAWGHGDSR